MSLKSIVAWAADGALKAVGGKSGTIAGTPIGDIKTGAGALIVALADLHARKFNFEHTEALANAIQSMLVDAGIEPKIVQEAILIGETVLPCVMDAYRAAGVNPFAPAPRGGPPLTEADWSHGIPKPQVVKNPSGAIGGDDAT